MKREELLKSKEYWLSKIQINLYNEIEKYLKVENITKTQFAEKLGVSKSYVTQVLNGDFDHKISKLVELTLAIEKIPILNLEELKTVLELDKINQLNRLENKGSLEFDFNHSFPICSPEESQREFIPIRRHTKVLRTSAYILEDGFILSANEPKNRYLIGKESQEPELQY